MKMIKNLFRKNKRTLANKLDRRVTRLVSLMDSLASKGLIYVSVENKQVVISSTLASLFMTNAERWRNFLSNVQLWFIYESSRLAWNKVFIDAELKAVREARKAKPFITDIERENIRERARQSVDIDAVSLPKLSPYSFVVIDDSAEEGKVEPVVVGTYSDGEFIMMNPDGASIIPEQKV